MLHVTSVKLSAKYFLVHDTKLPQRMRFIVHFPNHQTLFVD